jgi:hypothetical protein
VTPSAVTGLTADIVIETARVAEGLEEDDLTFERHAEGQKGWEEIVEIAVETKGERGIERTVLEKGERAKSG